MGGVREEGEREEGRRERREGERRERERGGREREGRERREGERQNITVSSKVHIYPVWNLLLPSHRHQLEGTRSL